MEDKGNGGGPPLVVPVLGILCSTPFVSFESCTLFIPKESADRTGMAGALSGGRFVMVPDESFRAGVCGRRCGGREGRIGGLSTSTVVTFGVDFVGFKPILDLSIS